MKKSIALLLALAMALGMLGAAAVTAHAADDEAKYAGKTLIKNVASVPTGDPEDATATVELWKTEFNNAQWKWIPLGTEPFATVTLEGKVGQNYTIHQPAFDFIPSGPFQDWYLVWNDRGTNVTVELNLFYEEDDDENITRMYFGWLGDVRYDRRVRPPVKSAQVNGGNWKTGSASKPIIVEAGDEIRYAITVYGHVDWEQGSPTMPPEYSASLPEYLASEPEVSACPACPAWPPFCFEEWRALVTDEIPGGLEIKEVEIPARGTPNHYWDYQPQPPLPPPDPWAIESAREDPDVAWAMHPSVLPITLHVKTTVEGMEDDEDAPRNYVNYACAEMWWYGEGGRFEGETNETFHKQLPPEPPDGPDDPDPPPPPPPPPCNFPWWPFLLLPLPIIPLLTALPVVFLPALLALCKLPLKAAGPEAEKPVPAPKTGESSTALYVALALLMVSTAGAAVALPRRKREA